MIRSSTGCTPGQQNCWRPTTGRTRNRRLSEPQPAKLMPTVNASAMTVEEFYKRNYYFPLLDHVISHFENRFSEASAAGLPPAAQQCAWADRWRPREHQGGVSTGPSSLPVQAMTKSWTGGSSGPRKREQTTSASSRLICWAVLLWLSSTQNVHAVLSLLLTLPVGWSSWERSFSAQSCLKTWTNTSMGKTRLDGLALLHMHQEHPVVTSLDSFQILKEWDASMHRRIALAFDHQQSECYPNQWGGLFLSTPCSRLTTSYYCCKLCIVKYTVISKRHGCLKCLTVLIKSSWQCR